MTPAWVAAYVGLEWDEHQLDCWDLARRVLREQWGVDLPDYRVERGDGGCEGNAWAVAVHAPEWRPVSYDAAQPGDLILFRIYGLPQHLGVVVAPGTFLHVEKGSNVTVERWEATRWRNRVLGLYRHPALVAA